MEVHEVPGEHVSIFKEPFVRVLADKLTGCLQAAQEVALSRLGPAADAAAEIAKIVVAPGS